MMRSVATLLCFVPALAFAQTLGGPLVGTSYVVNNGPGDQTDPHVSGSLVVYTSVAGGVSEIRYHDLKTGVDLPVPSSGAFDSVSDISGNTLVFTRVASTSSIFAYDVSTHGPATEIAPRAGVNRRSAVVGGRTVAWQDFSYPGTMLAPEIVTYNLDTHTLTRLTEDTLVNRTPAVSPDGQVIVWTKCQSSGSGCDIWQATAAPGGGFVSRQLTGDSGEESQPDTNGKVVVYASTRVVDGVAEQDIYWQPVGGGPEQRLALPGNDTNPSISGSLIAFERWDAAAAQPNYDIYLYDLESQTLYALTQTPEHENLNDISVGADGTVNVVWTVPENGDFDVHAFSFNLQRKEPNPCIPSEDTASAEEVCNAPGSRPELASVTVWRDKGKPSEARLSFKGHGEGVLCVDNGHEGSRATSGRVTLNCATEVGPSSFKKDVSLVAKRVSLVGSNALEAQVAGSPGSAFRVRVYGAPAVSCDPAAFAPGEKLVPGALIAPVTVTASSSSDERPEEAVGQGEDEGTPEVRMPGDVNGLAAHGPVGCGAAGGSLVSLGALALASLLLRRR